MICRYFFGIDFCMLFWMPFFRFFVENGRRKGSQKYKIWRPKSIQKRSKNASATQPRFFIDFGTHVGDILMILAHRLAIFSRQCRQFLLASCFKIFGFHGQHLKVSAVALQLQSADTGRCQAFQTNEASMPQAPPSEACPPYLPASTREIELAAEIALLSFFSVSNFGMIFGMPFFRYFFDF